MRSIATVQMRSIAVGWPKLEYDANAHAAYIKISDEPVAVTDELKHGILVDLDVFGEVVGVEILLKVAR